MPMKISMHTMAVDSFVPMLLSLSALLDKGEAHAKENNIDLPNARLAPDMYTLTQQVQIACDQAKNGVARLIGKEPPRFEDDETTIDALKARIAKTVAYLKSAEPIAFEGSEERDCTVPVPGRGIVIAMDGLQFLRAWALPHFYFHVVTAYDILRHCGVVIGKQDYLSQLGAFVRPIK
jgi:uncharacterized protein